MIMTQQYIKLNNVGTLSWFSLALAPKYRAVLQPCPSTTTLSLKEARVYRH